MKTPVAIFLFSLLASSLWAQEYPAKEYDLERLSEEIFAVQDQDIDYEMLYENLAQLLSNPIDLNTATADQLRSLYILNEFQVHGFMAYRDENGPLLSVYELQVIDGFDENTISSLVPFVTVRDGEGGMRSLPGRIRNEQNNYLLMRYGRTLEDRKGFLYDPSSSTNYKGSADRVYLRFRTAVRATLAWGQPWKKTQGKP